MNPIVVFGLGFLAALGLVGAVALLSRRSPRVGADLRPEPAKETPALGNVYRASGRDKEAVEALQKIIDSYGEQRLNEVARVHHQLASAYLVEGDVDKALEQLDIAFSAWKPRRWPTSSRRFVGVDLGGLVEASGAGRTAFGGLATPLRHRAPLHEPACARNLAMTRRYPPRSKWSRWLPGKK